MTTAHYVASGSTPGVQGDAGSGANGVMGYSTTGWSAIYGQATNSSASGVFGSNSSGNGGYGIYGSASGAGSCAIYGTTSGGVGVHGDGDVGVDASGVLTGVFAEGGNFAVHGHSDDGIGVSGSSNTSWAGYFTDDVYVSGNLVKGSGSFLIDHPLAPATRLLEHSFVESPERKNVYDGVAVADASGEATIELPSYFEALNRDFR